VRASPSWPARVRRYVAWLFGEDVSPDDVVYDPVHVAIVLVVVPAVSGILYWLLWSLLVCEGGIFVKIVPLFQVLLTSKTWSDFGYEGYPYKLGIFEGWVVNVTALALLMLALAVLWKIFEKNDGADGKTPPF